LPQHCYDLFCTMSLLHLESFPTSRAGWILSHSSWISFREGRHYHFIAQPRQHSLKIVTHDRFIIGDHNSQNSSHGITLNRRCARRYDS
jgi:hypothetical protein